MKWDMPVRPIESGPLTDREIEELDAFLLAEDGLENPMDFYTFDGFICAVLSGPNTIMPSERLQWGWDRGEGEQPPELRSEHHIARQSAWARRGNQDANLASVTTCYSRLPPPTSHPF